jgi:hypothetical protein
MTPEKNKNIMKTKMLIAAALFSAAVVSANAGVRVGFSIGVPQPLVVLPPPSASLQSSRRPWRL